MRFDPRLSRQETLEELVRDARATWGDDRLEAIQPALEVTAGAIWTIAQEQLEPTNVEP